MKSLILSICLLGLFMSCSVPTENHDKTFLEHALLINEGVSRSGGVYRTVKFQGVPETQQGYQQQLEDHLILDYLNENYFDNQVPDSIKYSDNKSNEQAREELLSILYEKEESMAIIEDFINPKKEKISISIDSLVSIASKLFMIINAGENQIGLIMCVGNIPYIELYSHEDFIKTIFIQAFSFQSLLEKRTAKDYDLWAEFEGHANSIVNEVSGLTHEEKVHFVQHKIWEEMAKSTILRDRLIDTYQSSNYKYFNLEI